MKMNLNVAMAAALSVLAVGGAQAALNSVTTGNSSVVFAAHNPIDQMTLIVDLGLSMSDLVRGGPLVGTPISWNFATNAVTGQAIAGSWNAAYAMFKTPTSANEFTWGVFAGDFVSGGAIPSSGWIATGNATEAQMAFVVANGNTGPGLTAMSQLYSAAPNFLTAVNTLNSADNGANVVTAGSAFGALGGNFLGRSPWRYLLANGEISTVQQLTAALNPTVFQVGLAPSLEAKFNDTPLQFQFDIATDTLQMAAPIPEPSTYALMLVGIAGLSFLARRRQR